MFVRSHETGGLKDALKRAPVVALVGPRQCGRSTLAKNLSAAGRGAYFDLEDPADLARLAEPIEALNSLRGLVVIDEVQHRPDLFPVLRVLADRHRTPARFLVLGEFTLNDAGAQSSGDIVGRHWKRGGFSRSYL
ncbi:MAG: AAA family ATPase [Phycisphaerae bacterium]|nr:AAA family ATPase [Phycisphaerae bacterium]